MSERKSFRARWIFPVDRPPLADGTLEIDAGRIVALHDRRDPQAVDLGNVALIPGLVNAHAHLEFSDLDAPIAPPVPFTAWLRAVIRSRTGRTISREESLVRGVHELLSQGTAVVGEIATLGWTAAAIADPRLHVVAFCELITLATERISAQLDALQQHERDCRDYSSIHPGVSPHAPYSVHPELFSAAVQHARDRDMPVAIHLAETIAEIELLKTGKGEFREFLLELGVWRDDVFPGDRTPLDYLKEMADVPHGLIVHGNYLGNEEAEFLAAHRNITVVYCPRTHAYFEHPPHPWKEFLTRGISLALGTDGRSSNPDLSLWNELVFLQKHHPDVLPETILSLGTLHGARSLGLEQEFGSLTPGKRAAVAVVALPEFADASTSAPYELLFSSASRMEGLLYHPIEPRTQ